MQYTNNNPLVVAGLSNSLNELVIRFLNGVGLSNHKEVKKNIKIINQQVVGFQEDILKSYSKESTHKELSETISSQHSNNAKSFLQEVIEEDQFVGWYTDTTLFLDLWKGVNEKANFLLVYSDPWVDFQYNSDDIDIDQFYKKWIEYNTLLLAFCKRFPDSCILIHSNDLLQNPEKVLDTVQQKFKFNFLNKGDYSIISRTDFFSAEYDLGQVKYLKGEDGIVELLHQLKTNSLLKKELVYSSKNSQAEVTVVIPVYNDGEYLIDAISSVERDLYSSCDIIIINDGSTDLYTLDLLSKLKNDGYNVVHQENKGLSEARNLGIKNANTEYILLLDADNKIDPNYYKEAVKILDNDSKVGVVYAKPRVFGVSNHFRKNLEFDIDRLLAGNFIDACAIIRKKVWESVGGYDFEIPEKLGYEDWEFWISAYSQGWKFHYIDKYLFDYRVKTNSMAEKCNLPENRVKLVQYVTKKHSGLYQERLSKVLSKIHLHALGLEKVASQRLTSLLNTIESNKKLSSENNKLLGSLKGFEKEKNDLKSQIEEIAKSKELLSELENVKNKHSDDILELQKLKNELSIANDKIFQHDIQASKVQQEREDTLTELKNSNLEIVSSIKNEFKAQAEEQEEKRVELLSKNKEKVDELEKENINLREEIVSLNQGVENYKLLLDSVAEEKKNYLSLLENNQKNVELSSIALNQANEQLEYKESQVGLFQGTVNTLQNKISEYENSKSAKVKKLLRKIFDYFFVIDSDRNILLQLLSRFRFLLTPVGLFMSKKLFKKLFLKMYLYLEEQQVRISYGGQSDASYQEEESTTHIVDPDVRYRRWIGQNFPRVTDFNMYSEVIKLLPYQPKISIIVPAYNPPIKYFRQMINSVINQVYTNWELCVSDDNSSDPEVKKVIKEYAAKDKRIKYVFRKKNGHISANSNSALEIATGEFCSLLDHDDLLTRDALYQVILALNKNKELDYIYSDEDKVDDSGQFTNPYFKPDFLPDYLLSINYVTHFSTYRKAILDEIGGFRVGFEGSQDHDLVLRFTEKTTKDKILHIPRILYHWRIHSESTAAGAEVKTYAYEASKKAINEALERRGESGEVSIMPGYIGYNVQYHIKEEKKVSIIIPTKDQTPVLKTCVDSIIAKTNYSNYEIIVVDNNSEEKEFFDFVKKYEKDYEGIFKCYSHKIPFNFSKLMNFGTKKSKGDYLLFMNNDMEVISEGWLEKMVGQVQRDSIGAVGAKLLFHNDTIQHAGVVIGFGGIAGHTYVKYPRNFDGHFNNANLTRNYSAVTGACLMCRRDVLEEAGMWDEKFEVEFNDIDLCLRIKDLGYNNLSMADVVIYHYESLSRGNPLKTQASRERHIREVTRFVTKYKPYIENDPCYNPNLTLKNCNFEIGITRAERHDIIHIYDQLLK